MDLDEGSLEVPLRALVRSFEVKTAAGAMSSVHRFAAVIRRSLLVGLQGDKQRSSVVGTSDALPNPRVEMDDKTAAALSRALIAAVSMESQAAVHLAALEVVLVAASFDNFRAAFTVQEGPTLLSTRASASTARAIERFRATSFREAAQQLQLLAAFFITCHTFLRRALEAKEALGNLQAQFHGASVAAYTLMQKGENCFEGIGNGELARQEAAAFLAFVVDEDLVAFQSLSDGASKEESASDWRSGLEIYMHRSQTRTSYQTSAGLPRAAAESTRDCQQVYFRRAQRNDYYSSPSVYIKPNLASCHDSTVYCAFNAATAQYEFAFDLAPFQVGMTLRKPDDSNRMRGNAEIELCAELSSLTDWSRQCLETVKHELLILPGSFQARRKALAVVKHRLQGVIPSLEMLVRLARITGSAALADGLDMLTHLEGWEALTIIDAR